MICSLDEGKAVWSTEVVQTAAKDLENGAKNQAAIEKLPDWQRKYPAFAWCATKNVNGVVGWYLPAYEELLALSDVWDADKDALNKSLTDHGGEALTAAMDADGFYWTSSEDITDAEYAVAYSFAEERPGFQLKSISLRVRAVCRF